MCTFLSIGGFFVHKITKSKAFGHPTPMMLWCGEKRGKKMSPFSNYEDISPARKMKNADLMQSKEEKILLTLW